MDGEVTTLWVLKVYIRSNPLAGLLYKEISGPTSEDANLVNKDYVI